MGRDPDEKVSECEHTAGTEVMGKAVDFEGAGAAEEEKTNRFTRIDKEWAGDIAQRTKVSRSVSLVGVSMTVEEPEGVKETNSTEESLKEGEC